jgi:PAS domain S-box-containing protein
MFASVAARAAQKQESAGRLERAAAGLPLRTSFLLLVGVLGVALGGSFLRSSLRDELSAADTDKLIALSRQVRAVREHLEHAGAAGSAGELRSQFGTPEEEPSLRLAMVVSPGGTVLDAFHGERIGAQVSDVLRESGESERLSAEIDEVRATRSTRSHIDGDRVVVVSPISTKEASVVVAVASVAAVRASVRAGIVREAAALALVLLALVAALWMWLELVLNRRVRRLVDAAARLAADDLDARARLGGSDELAMAGRAFDAMADSVAQTRMRLLESEERVRLLLDSTAEGLCGLDLSGRITFCNPAALRLLRVDHPGELLGRPFYDLLRLPGSEQTLDKAWVQLALQTRARVEQELSLPCGDGSVLAVHHSGGPVLLQGELVGRVVTLSDLTGKKRAEEELRKSQAQLRMADRLATVGTLSAGVAHEINNPLAYTLANLGYVAERLTELPAYPDSGEVNSAVEEAIEGAERVRRIVKDMKTLSRVDDESIGAVDIERALDASINMALHELRHKATVMKDYAGVGFARGNEGRLVQVFLNLLVNAAQAIATSQPDVNEVRIATCLDAEGRIAVEISDTGAGIPEDVLPRIFDPFYTTKPLGVGTGLGLSICHSLITAVGGQIEVASKVGVGTRFLIILPSVAQDQAVPVIRPAA